MASVVQDRPLSFGEQVRSYNKIFWISNFMEMIERWAYYGVRTVLALYIVGATAEGGLNFTHIDKGNIYLWWAVIQSFLPMFTGGISDAFGYKKTISVAITFKIVGYVLMATQTSFGGFFAGCMTLATGTALFKPGVQGLIAHSTNDKNASVAWGIFYQLVNIGGFLGPIYATFLRHQGNNSWWWVFAGNAVLVAVNYLTLLMFKEPEVARPPMPTSVWAFLKDIDRIFVVSIVDIMQPRLRFFVLIFSGFWFSFNQLFDLLPNFIDDWVDTSALNLWAVTTFFPVINGLGHLTAWMGTFVGGDGKVPDYIALAKAGAQIAPETMLNINPAAIVFLMLPIAFFASRIPALVAITGGILVAVVGILTAGATQSGWMCALGILVFSLGEMLASPRTNDYCASIAPDEKKGQYLGYANVPNGIGWAVGSIFAGNFYEYHGDKVNFAREALEKGGMTKDAVAAIPKDKVMQTLADHLHLTVPQATQQLWNQNHPAAVWYWIAGVGLVSLVGMIAYNAILGRLDRHAPASAVATPSPHLAGPAADGMWTAVPQTHDGHVVPVEPPSGDA